MAWKRTITWTRPNTGVSFEYFNSSLLTYIKNNFTDTGKMTIVSITTSGDGLKRLVERVFTNENTKDEFLADSTIINAANTKKSVMTGRGISRAVTFNGTV